MQRTEFDKCDQILDCKVVQKLTKEDFTQEVSIASCKKHINEMYLGTSFFDTKRYGKECFSALEGGNSKCRGCEFESRYHIVTRRKFSHLRM